MITMAAEDDELVVVEDKDEVAVAVAVVPHPSVLMQVSHLWCLRIAKVLDLKEPRSWISRSQEAKIHGAKMQSHQGAWQVTQSLLV